MTDDTRRHWHGTSGNRHEHHNTWVAGGAKSPAGRAPWALTPEMTSNLNARRVCLSPSTPTYALPSIPMPRSIPMSVYVYTYTNACSRTQPAQPHHQPAIMLPLPLIPPPQTHQLSPSADAQVRVVEVYFPICRLRRGRVGVRIWRGEGLVGMSRVLRVVCFRNFGRGILGGIRFV